MSPSESTLPPGPLPFGWSGVVSLVLLGAARLVLVSHDEIITRGFDDFGYATCANAWYWGNAYGLYAYNRQPVFPLLAAVSGALGVPWRIFVELAWLLACVLIARALRDCGVKTVTSILIFAVTLFEPMSLSLFNRLLPDGPYTVAFVVMLAGLIGTLAARSSRRLAGWSVAASVGAALAANIRPESAVVYAVVGLAGVLATARWWSGLRLDLSEEPGLAARLIAVALAPVLASQALTHTLAIANRARIGVYTTYDLATPGNRALYRTLLSIPTQTHHLMLPAPRDAREKAYSASPEFARLRPYLDGERAVNPAGRQTCLWQTGVEGELGSWTVWGLREAAWQAEIDRSGRPFASADELERFYLACAEELRQAQREGRLASRWAPTDFIPPEWGLLARQGPGAAWRQLLRLGDRGYRRERPDTLAPEGERAFDAAALRRIPQNAVSRAGRFEGSAWFSEEKVRRFDRLKAGIARVQNGLVCVGAPIALAGLAVALACWRRFVREGRDGLAMAIILLGGAFAGRWALVTLLDLSGVLVPDMPAPGVPVLQSRYMFAMSAIAGAWIVAGGGLLLGMLPMGRRAPEVVTAGTDGVRLR